MNKKMNKTLIIVLSIAVFVLFFVGFTVGAILIFSIFESGGPNPSEGEFLLLFLLGRVTPILGGFLCAYLIYRRLVTRSPAECTGSYKGRTATLALQKAVIWTLIALYLLTWSMGVPSVQSSITKRSVDAYKRMKKEHPEQVWDAHPYIKSYIAFPLLPGIILTYHECQLARLSGYGGWDIHLWYLIGTKRLWSLPSWIS